MISENGFVVIISKFIEAQLVCHVLYVKIKQMKILETQLSEPSYQTTRFCQMKMKSFVAESCKLIIFLLDF